MQGYCCPAHGLAAAPSEKGLASLPSRYTIGNNMYICPQHCLRHVQRSDQLSVSVPCE